MDLFGRRNPPPDDMPDDDDDDISETPPAQIEDESDTLQEQKEDMPPTSRLFDTALGAGSTIEGNLSSDGNVRIDGVFKGALEIGENILIGVTAEVEADVVAKNVSIGGSVRGNVVGKKVHLLATAQVWGDIEAQSIITEDGAFIEGRISMTKARNGEFALPYRAGGHDETSEENSEEETG